MGLLIDVSKLYRDDEKLATENIFYSLPIVKSLIFLIGPTILFTSYGLRTGFFRIDWFDFKIKFAVFELWNCS